MTGRLTRAGSGSTGASDPARAESVYDAEARFSLSASLVELWQYREVVLSFGLRRIRTRYKQAIFGFGWAVIQPLAFLVLFVVFLNRAIGGFEPGYAAGSYGALVGWQFASTAMTAAGSSLVSESGMLRKVFFPREAPILGAVGAYLPDLAINTVFLCLLVPFLGGMVGWQWILTPVPYLVLIVVALAVGMPLGALAVYYRDVLYVLPIAVQLLLFASPVAYSIDQFDDRWHHPYAALNPLVGPLSALRDIYGSGQTPDWSLVATSTTSAVLILALGYRLLKALDRRMADVV